MAIAEVVRQSTKMPNVAAVAGNPDRLSRPR